MIRIPLYGLNSLIQVKERWSSLSMPAMGAALAPEALAAALSYIRGSFGNHASPVSAA